MDESVRLGDKPIGEMTDRELGEATLAEVRLLHELLLDEPPVSSNIFLRLGILLAGVWEMKKRSDERGDVG